MGFASTSHNNGATIPLAKSILTDFSVTVPVVANPAVFDGVTVNGANLDVTWQNGGELMTAPAVDGPYTGTGNTSDVTVTLSGQTLTVTSTGSSTDILNVLGEGDRALVTIQSGPTYQYFDSTGSWILQ